MKHTGTFYRGIPVILFTVIASLMIAKRYLKYVTPQYESTVKIKLADIHDGVPNSNLYKDFDVFVSNNKLGAEVELLKSTSLVRKAINKLSLQLSVFRMGGLHNTELYDQSPFLINVHINNDKWYDQPFNFVVSGDGLIQLVTPDGEKIQGRMNQLIRTSGADINIMSNTAYLKKRPGLKVNDRYQFIIHSENKLVDNVIAGLDVMSVDKDIPVLRISYKSAVPRKSADVVNALAAAYIEDYVESKYKSADTTEEFLNQQMKTYGGNLVASENAIESYRDKKNIINIHQEKETDLRKIADLKKQLASVAMNLHAVDSLNVYVKNGKQEFLELAPNFEAFTDLLSTELVKKTKELQREKRDLLLRYTPENEKVKVVDDKLEDINKYLEESIKNTESNLRIKYNDLQQNIEDAESVFNGLPTREKNMTILERNFGLNEQIYRFLHEKRTEAQIAKAATISFHRVISEGEIPTKPVSPNVAIIKILSVILGFFAGITIVFGIHVVKGRVTDEETINRLSDIPVIAAIPYCKKEKDIQQYFSRWQLQLELQGRLKKGMMIVVTSFDKEEGKSFICNGLYKTFLRAGKSACVVNPEGGSPASWKSQCNLLKEQYDILLVNNKAVNEDPAAMIPMTDADLNLFVFDSRRTRKSSVTAAELLRNDIQIPSMYFVLNRAGYIPSLIRQIKDLFSKLFKREHHENSMA